MRILVFGDSIAQGQWATTAGWVQRLFLDEAADVASHPGSVDHVTLNLAIGGETTKGIINRLANEIDVRIWEGEPVILVFAVGVNDAAVWDNEAVSNSESYAHDLYELYKIAQKYSDKIIFVGLTPVEDDNPLCNSGYSNERIWQFEEILRQFVAEKKVAFVPVFEPMQERMKVEALMVDGLHPNDAGHKFMYEQIKPALKALLTTF